MLLSRKPHIFICTSTIIVFLSSAQAANAQTFFHRPLQQEYLHVRNVPRVDTIVLDNEEKIRLIGLKAPPLPEKKDLKRNEYGIIIREVSPLVSVNEKALLFAQKLLEGKDVRLEFDKQKTNDDFETLAYVFLKDGTFVNAEILRQGFADLKLVPLNTKYEQKLRAAYQEARREKRGLRGQ